MEDAPPSFVIAVRPALGWAALTCSVSWSMSSARAEEVPIAQPAASSARQGGGGRPPASRPCKYILILCSLASTWGQRGLWSQIRHTTHDAATAVPEFSEDGSGAGACAPAVVRRRARYPERGGYSAPLDLRYVSRRALADPASCRCVAIAVLLLQ